MKLRQPHQSGFAVILLGVALSGCSYFRTATPTWFVVVQIESEGQDKRAVDQTKAAITKRLEMLGVRGVVFETRDGPNGPQLVVKMPDVSDRERTKRLILNNARLEMLPVVSPPSPAAMQTYATRDEAERSAASSNGDVLPIADDIRGRDGPIARFAVVEKKPIITGEDILDANVPTSRGEGATVAFKLKPDGAARLSRWTRSNINNYLAIVLGRSIVSAPSIQSEISDSAEITGRFSSAEAEDLALVLRSGDLPFPLRIVEEGNL